MKRIQTQFLAAQNEGANVQAEIERLQALSGQLEQTVAQKNEAAARAAETERAVAAWKKRTRDQLMAADFQWDDESLFARIPKSALPELCGRIYPDAWDEPGIVKPYARELLGLTSAEREAVQPGRRQQPDPSLGTSMANSPDCWPPLARTASAMPPVKLKWSARILPVGR